MNEPGASVVRLAKNKLQHLSRRGMRISQISDHAFLLQDINEWLWVDQQRLVNSCSSRLCFNIYAVNQENTIGDINGLVVSVTVIDRDPLTACFHYAIAFLASIVFVIWFHKVFSLYGWIIF